MTETKMKKKLKNQPTSNGERGKRKTQKSNGKRETKEKGENENRKTKAKNQFEFELFFLIVEDRHWEPAREGVPRPVAILAQGFVSRVCL